MLAILDYGLGNVKSVANAARALDIPFILTRETREVLDAQALIIPGVGAFEQGMKNLQENNLIESVKEFAKTGKPLLGICLGMQLLFDTSCEHGQTRGLGIIPGNVIELKWLAKTQNLLVPRLPHVGWRPVNDTANTIPGLKNNSHYYFVHSLVAVPHSEVTQTANAYYEGITFCAGIRFENIIGVQFHPEKSAEAGLAIILSFYQLSEG